jgi:hypothetical protein
MKKKTCLECREISDFCLVCHGLKSLGITDLHIRSLKFSLYEIIKFK